MTSAKIGGYAGKFLRVDMTTGKTTEERPSEMTLRQYLGGTGFGTKILYEEVSPGTEWSDPDNRLVIASGPLGATSVCGSGTYSVVTKGALTNGATSVQANGLFGAYLKLAGFDGIILQGRADRWQYLYLHDGVAELRDASALVGKDTWETEDIVKAELGAKGRAMSVCSIGPGGENLVRFAAIVGDKGHVAAHNGVGAVMGSKKLKAIAAARGKREVTVADKERLSKLAKELIELVRTKWPTNYYEGTLDGVLRLEKAGQLPIKNYTTNVWNIDKQELEKFGCEYIRDHFQAKRNPCWACPAHHCHILRVPDGPYAGFIGEEPEYECLAAWSALTGNMDVSSTIVLANQVDRLGFDTNESGFLLSLVIECYEKGVLTKKDTDGLEMTWGNVPAISAMLKKIAHRDGFGNVLAEGVMRAARHIGGEAPNMAVHSAKGNAPRGHDHRSLWFEMFDTCVSDTGTIESHRHMDPKVLGLHSLSNNFAAEEIARMVAAIRGVMPFEDSLGICRFTTRSQLNYLADMLQAATGWDYTAHEGNTAGRKFASLLRAFNVRHGHTPSMEFPSPRYGSAPVDGPAQGESIMADWSQMLDIYYEEMGWDRETGKPLPDTLKALGLEKVAVQLW